MAERLCLRCGKPILKPYKHEGGGSATRYHYICKKEADAELRARIEAMPETVVTDEDVRRFFMPEIEESPLKAALRSIESADVGAPTDPERKECLG